MMSMGSIVRYATMLLLTAATGCGTDDQGPRVGVTGKVTLGGEPLVTGNIAFVPLGSGPAVQGSIEGGVYNIPQSEGPGSGNYRVEVYSVQPTGRKVPDRGLSNEIVDEKRNVIPRRYNLESQLRATFAPPGDQELDFSLDQREFSGDPSKSARARRIGVR